MTPAQAERYESVHEAAGISFHKPNWIMFGSWADEYDGDESEVVFQFSVKKQIAYSNFYVAYTQRSYWQAYNTDESSPFRETNYNPEIFYRIHPENALARWLGNGPFIGSLGMDIGFEHESNGRSMPESRSWNRAYIAPYYAYEHLMITLKAWYITEDSKETPTDGESGSNNPDIADYMGYGEISVKYQTAYEQMFDLRVRGNTKTNKGGANLIWSIPLGYEGAFVMVQGYHGYGESLIDYNRSISRVGVGLMLTR
ncbi:phospholipase A [Desulfoluna spongiiphila]|uniref:phospholipase A n=1 Tax=Desulfoluna spongiiphila TaxID=419481 RepID=UPI001869BC21|nr:phospholipase A [Desulfoluna spongiiphila]